MRAARYPVFLLLIVALMSLSGGTAAAHHSFAATYIENQTITVEGEMVQFQFRNPHSFVDIVSTEKDGTMIRWAVEWGGTSQLSGTGVTVATLKPGDHVIISGNPGRDPADHRIRMMMLVRPSDGFVWGKKPDEVVK